MFFKEIECHSKSLAKEPAQLAGSHLRSVGAQWTVIALVASVIDSARVSRSEVDVFRVPRGATMFLGSKRPYIYLKH